MNDKQQRDIIQMHEDIEIMRLNGYNVRIEFKQGYHDDTIYSAEIRSHTWKTFNDSLVHKGVSSLGAPDAYTLARNNLRETRAAEGEAPPF